MAPPRICLYGPIKNVGACVVKMLIRGLPKWLNGQNTAVHTLGVHVNDAKHFRMSAVADFLLRLSCGYLPGKNEVVVDTHLCSCLPW